VSLLFLVPAILLVAFIPSDQLGWVGKSLVSAVAALPTALFVYRSAQGLHDRPLISREALLFLHLVALVCAFVALAYGTHDWFILSSTGVVAFFTTAMLAHRTLYEARPAPRYLTEFYLWMSLGGALGGMFTALLAPRLFPEVYEYPLLLALSMACRPGALSLPKDNGKAFNEAIALWLTAAAGILVLLWVPTTFVFERVPFVVQHGTTLSAVLLFAALLAFTVRHPPRQLVAAALVCLALTWLPSAVRHEAKLTKRSFFGVYRVQDPRADQPDPLGYFRTLNHGTTLHGAQRIADRYGRSVDDTTPTTYYYPGSPIGQTIQKRREILAAQNLKGHYGIVGLGTGSSACHKQEGETWRFFEIDPTVIAISSDPKNFTFISKCQRPALDVKVGDARLTIAKEPDESFDLFIIDAFTSDAIPVHMLTKEAIELFLRKLKPDGVVLLHTSNRYLNLNSVLGAIKELLPKGTAGIGMSDNGTASSGATGSSVVVFARSVEALEPYRQLEGASDLDPKGLRAWTDDYSDILGAFMSRLRGDR
jgi:SAM-dependent methyltransferase